MAPNRDYRSQTYMMLTRRLAHLRYDVVLSAMRYEKWIPLRWEKTHRLYRLAMQQSLHEVGAPGKGIAERAVLENSAESEYIQILLTHQLNQGQLDPRDILRAVGWLARWVDKLSVTKTPGSGSAFALYPDGRAGLIEPPRTDRKSVV